ncbi:hypothetical protein NLG97_g1149 [Lecanicillium saksenae]|uniref:Uncharacterized protein n=1 Tax=Lecanicillium saksenae TaxID=468837 RepID=A0ACC1R4J2_9HYPO|nr:hypothetical protein NLG97_g1149 [Lecanicillium saksenae]
MVVIMRLVCATILALSAVGRSDLGLRAVSGKPSKYFSELPYRERRIALRNLMRSYLEIMQATGVETWLAHGTLLGWWWNAQIMPWDYDLDVQVTGATMAWLAENLNGTEHAYNFTGGSETVRDGAEASSAANHTHHRTYLLDINPHHTELNSRGGDNLIDGRWIDLESGIFVDITELRERASQSDTGVWSCKNNHRYKAQDLWPLRITEFEGVPARIPYQFENILVKEYSKKSLAKERHQHHQWSHELKQWVTDDPEQRESAKASGASFKKQQLDYQIRFEELPKHDTSISK